ncbi:endopeptidase La [Spongiibacter sp. IMCC21906]|jgi:ATP-dependent Lon protease|uniref:endopeptidase La n=1 Tax=Spongiibacter sp. IMCC21906 TaxID=1620392 RepID=UPI00062DE1BA|nr:endopeptidase La [Spongiibacter sp. IMCC21906]AKH68774.1 endopeptidase La [Spongiibacter sp. IMCC21906]
MTDDQSYDNILDGEMLNHDAQGGTGLMIPDSVLPSRLYLLPSPKRPFFPGQAQPIVLDIDLWEETLTRVAKTQDKVLGLLYCDDANPAELDPTQLPAVGCVARLHQAHKDENAAQILVQGLKRFRIRRWLSDKPPYLVEVDYPDNIGERDSDEVKAYAMAIIKAIKELLAINPLYSEELKQYLSRFSPNEPSVLVDFAAAITTAKGDALQDIIETIPLLRRMEKVLTLLTREREVAELQGHISAQVNEKISANQREFFLREQLKVIQRELGISKDDRTADAEEFRNNLKGKTLTDAARKRIDDEINKLEVLESGSPEYGVTRNYLDWASQLPWGVYSKDRLDLQHARKVLDAQHSGLADVKDRIIEFLAVGKFKGTVAGSIVLLVGPPGVGKTSIGRSIADALGRKFYRFSLGGMRDEAEIKGHRRTYIGAMPGKLVQALKEVETANPVIMLDEIDKLGTSFQGDPASAMLEVLDPEQNSEFLDHYLDLRFDLSKVLFVCTANQLDTIPGPLLDRMEMIRLAGYLGEEKLTIAKKHLWPRLLQRNGIDKKRLNINTAALRHIIDGYAREAGVRGLEKQLARIVRKAAVRLLEDEALVLKVGRDEVEDMLGKPLFKREKPQQGVGLVTGLAWTAMGGATLGVECSRIHTLTRGFQLSGQLGDVMKESANIAYGHVMSNLERFGADASFFNESMVHLHVPEGATPKDGPSAGITMATSLLSLALNKAPKTGFAMTGELTLTGQVLPVGGIREKVIAAKRVGIKKLILPEDNRRDFDELPEHVRKGVTVHFAAQFDDVRGLLFS